MTITPEPVDPSRFRTVLSHFASGVTVITGSVPGGPAGLSLQSFAALSLDPPMVLVLPSRCSASWARIQDNGQFCVNVLAADQESLAMRFARAGGDKFDGVTWSPGVLGDPRISGACAWIECEVHAVHEGGDHLVVLGNVRALDAVAGAEPLLFHRGGYERLARVP